MQQAIAAYTTEGVPHLVERQYRGGSEERVLKSIADPADEVEEGEFDLLEEHPGQGV